MSSESVPSLQAALLQSNLVQGDRIILRTPLIHIGRSVTSSSDIAIRADDVQSSREHATLLLENGQWYLEDTSRNGTVVSGKVITRTKVPIHGNDRIQIGTTFDYTFKLIVETSHSSPSDNAARSFAAT